MGFLRFLKKDQKKQSSQPADLDVPPAPPENYGDVSHDDLNIPFPGDEMGQELQGGQGQYAQQPQPGFGQGQEQTPQSDFGLGGQQGQGSDDFGLGDDMDLPSLDDEIPPLDADDTQQDQPGSPGQEFMGAQSQRNDAPQYPSAPAPSQPAAGAQSFQPRPQQPSQGYPSMTRKPVRHQGGSLYVKVDMFKEVMSNLQYVRSELRKSDKNLADVTQDIAKKDKEFEKWQSTLGEIQKKLIYVDKTLFKGDHR